MKARRTTLADCDVQAGEYYLYIRDGIIIDCSGREGKIIELVCGLAGAGPYRYVRDDAQRFLEKMAGTNISEKNLLNEAANEMAANEMIIWNMYPEHTNCIEVKLEDVYELHAQNLSRALRKKIYDMIRPERILYFTLYQKAGGDIIPYIAERMRECENIGEVKDAIYGSLEYWKVAYAECMKGKIYKSEKKALRKFLKKVYSQAG